MCSPGELSTLPDNAILVTAVVVGLYPSIPHEGGLKAIREALDKQEVKCIPTEDLVVCVKEQLL